MKARVLVGRNIRRLRVECGFPQEALGYAAGCEPSYIGRIERGRENVGVDLLEAIASALGAEVADLFVLPAGDLLPGLPSGRKPRATVAVDGKGVIAASDTKVKRRRRPS